MSHFSSRLHMKDGHGRCGYGRTGEKEPSKHVPQPKWVREAPWFIAWLIICMVGGAIFNAVMNRLGL